jgi:NAD(P)-dependent dehydrogenase (short-subunit alcohol dehydrogenase family)
VAGFGATVKIVKLLTNRFHSTQKILDENPDLKQKWTSHIPQGKMGQPQDLMGPVTFLLSDASGYVTGADIRVDGGYTVT